MQATPLDKAGHFYFREYPEEFIQTMLNFIESWDKNETDRAAANAN